MIEEVEKRLMQKSQMRDKISEKQAVRRNTFTCSLRL